MRRGRADPNRQWLYGEIGRVLSDARIPIKISNNSRAVDAVSRATNALVLLDALEADPVRRAAAIADVRARWP